jgi:hypothetical protein
MVAAHDMIVICILLVNVVMEKFAGKLLVSFVHLNFTT